jgi:hypothetical protein
VLGGLIPQQWGATPTRGADAFRRVDWVRIDLSGPHPRALAHGAGHRLPRTVAVPVRDAVRLAADGVPLVVRHPAGGPS